MVPGLTGQMKWIANGHRQYLVFNSRYLSGFYSNFAEVKGEFSPGVDSNEKRLSALQQVTCWWVWEN